MAEDPGRGCKDDEEEYCRAVSVKGKRMIQARKRGDEGVWFGLGMFGLVGWSVAVPVVLGVAAGVWIDRRWPSQYSWTLMLLLGGMILGCLNAWYWLSREREGIERSRREFSDDDE